MRAGSGSPWLILVLAAAASAQQPAAEGVPVPLQTETATPPAHARVIEMESMDEIHLLRTAIRRVTTLFLPPDENLLQAWTGDSEFWAVQGSGNLVFIKPAQTDLRTNAALTTEAGRVYHFELLSVDPAEASDLAVRVERQDLLAGDSRPAPPSGFGLPAVRFVPATAVAEYRASAQSALEDLSDLEARIPELVADERDRVRRVLAAEMRFAYRFQESLTQPPFDVRGMWHDGDFTYIRTAAMETPALYVVGEEGRPELVDYELESTGLLVARGVLGDGWMQIGDQRARWMLELEDDPSEQLLGAGRN